MKKHLQSAFVLAALVVLCTACNNDGLPQPADRVLKVNAVIPGEAQTRTSIDINDSYNINPDFTKGEAFFWEDTEEFCALIWDDASTSDVASIPSTSVSDNKKRVFFEVKIPGIYTAGSCRIVYPAKTISDNQTVTMNVPTVQTDMEFNKYNYMYTDELAFTETSGDITNVSFHHQSALLRFNVLNLTSRKYVVESISVGYVDNDMVIIDNVIPATLTFDMQTAETSVASYLPMLVWNHSGYADAAPMLDDAITTDKHEGVFDAIMVTLPTARQTSGKFVVSMTLYDKDKQTSFYPTPMSLNCADYDFLSGEINGGFKAGERTYFCIDITEDNILRLKGVQVEEWGDGGDIVNGEQEMIEE